MELFDAVPKVVRLTDAESAARLFAPLAEVELEIAAFAYLAPDGRLLGLRHTPALCADRVHLPIRTIAADALGLGADALVIAHNHPGGDPTPSAADRDATRLLARALDPLGIRLLDHLVMARGRTASFRALGFL